MWPRLNGNDLLQVEQHTRRTGLAQIDACGRFVLAIPGKLWPAIAVEGPNVSWEQRPAHNGDT
eukprot:scaffold62272_cov69-Phaeocystis_antarctica.AAC.2